MARRETGVTRPLKGIVVVAAASLCALFGVGFLLGALFEAQGFGRRSSEPREWYLALMAVGFVACVAVPVALWRRLLPGNAPAWAVGAVLAVLGVVLILGMSLRG